MTDFLKFKNFGGGVLDEAIDDSQTSIVLGSGQGATFPDDSFVVLIHNANPDTESELVHVSGRTGDTLTGCTRGYESTTPRAFEAGSFVENVITEAALDQFRVAYNGLLEPDFPWIWTADNAETEPMFQLRQNGSGDAALRFRLGASTANFSVGIDNSVTGDPLKISASGALGTSDVFEMTSTGNIALAGAAIPTTGSNWRVIACAGGSVMLGTATGGSNHFNQNCYFDGSNWRFQNGTGQRATNQFLSAGAFSVRTSSSTGNAGDVITWVDAISVSTAAAVTIPKTLTVGDASNTLAVPVSGAALEPSSSAGVQRWDYFPVNDYWSPVASGSTNRISARAPTSSAGSVLQSIRFHVYDTDPSNNRWDFAIVSTIHTTSGAPSNSAIAAALNQNVSSTGTQKGSTDHYYFTFSTGNFPYTIGALDAIQAQVAADADSDPTTMRLYMIEFVYRARKI